MAKVEIPEASIRWLIGRVHVGTSDAEIEADMIRRCSTATPQQKRACIKYALKCHRENQALYDHVMSGH
jgi:hypothetical protein